MGEPLYYCGGSKDDVGSYHAPHPSPQGAGKEPKWCHGDPTIKPPTLLESAMHSVWLHGNWRFLTSKMTTPEKEATWAAVKNYSRHLNDGEELEDGDWTWWRG